MSLQSVLVPVRVYESDKILDPSKAVFSINVEHREAALLLKDKLVKTYPAPFCIRVGVHRVRKVPTAHAAAYH